MEQSKRVFNFLLTLLILGGLGFMCSRLILGFRIDSHIGGQHDDAFERHFWNWFYVATGLYLVGCFGFGKTLEPRTARRTGVIAMAASIALYFLLCGVMRAIFEGWSGAAALMLVYAVFIGGVLLLIPSGINWARKRFKTRASTD
jgi:hypothetical protein